MKRTMEKRESKTEQGRLEVAGSEWQVEMLNVVVRVDLVDQRSEGFKGTISVDIRKKNVPNREISWNKGPTDEQVGEGQEGQHSLSKGSRSGEGRKGSQR